MTGPRIPGRIDWLIVAVVASIAGIVYLSRAGWFSGPQPAGYLVVLVVAACTVIGVAERMGR